MSQPPDIQDLPEPNTAEGTPRRVGVEIELGGLPETQVADIVRDTFGGEIARREDKGLVVEGGELGDMEVYLDTAYLGRPEGKFAESVHNVARTVVPVEIVTQPIEPARIADLDRLVVRLRDAGATGTSAGLFLGFGVHFNPEIVAPEIDRVLPVVTVFALCEDALRREMGIDIARRVLPFIETYPRPLLDGLAADSRPGDMTALIDLYLERAPSRNHGLDMTCLFAHLDRDRVATRMDMGLVSARPTYHYRLPDCRIDEPDWSLALEWNRWVRIERLAADAGLVGALCREWRAHRAALATLRSDWTRHVTEKLGAFA
ncbi:amidoligase family protein [Roseivivax isoporae]|uniref:Amidoligase enzyme n=1 Tax=Roseivivax isoporae LMG 25204 TaxID=1449351 RepID=X7F397_9RHOB|nr:amidoligase family protein [Roseivivax isoporae]ETX27290.1 hypothetical protein RISW2_14920 [Roseivivax isoporae LMG 25204]